MPRSCGWGFDVVGNLTRLEQGVCPTLEVCPRTLWCGEVDEAIVDERVVTSFHDALCDELACLVVRHDCLSLRFDTASIAMPVSMMMPTTPHAPASMRLTLKSNWTIVYGFEV